MKTPLAVVLLAGLAAASLAGPPTSTELPAAGDRGAQFRYEFCIKNGMEECDSAVERCRQDREPIYDCVAAKDMACVVDMGPRCSASVDDCIRNATATGDDVRACMVEKRVWMGDLHIGEEQRRALCDALSRTFMAAASAYNATWTREDCDNRVDDACHDAYAEYTKAEQAFDVAWEADGCEAFLAQYGAAPGGAGNGASVVESV